MVLYSAANCFPASVETVENPELRDKKIAVCIKKIQNQYAVLSANYTAMLSGVKAGISISMERLKKKLFINGTSGFCRIKALQIANCAVGRTFRVRFERSSWIAVF